jgi:hypothetical protein
LGAFEEGSLTDDALMKVYGFDQDELDSQWRESIGVPARVEVGERTTPEAPETTEPAGGICWGALPGLALAVLSLSFQFQRKSGERGGF